MYCRPPVRSSSACGPWRGRRRARRSRPRSSGAAGADPGSPSRRSGPCRACARERRRAAPALELIGSSPRRPGAGLDRPHRRHRIHGDATPVRIGVRVAMGATPRESGGSFAGRMRLAGGARSGRRGAAATRLLAGLLTASSRRSPDLRRSDLASPRRRIRRGRRARAPRRRTPIRFRRFARGVGSARSGAPSSRPRDIPIHDSRRRTGRLEPVTEARLSASKPIDSAAGGRARPAAGGGPPRR